jgi:hypothetical protein
MNTNLTDTPLATRTTALAACLIALFAGATACGTNDGTATAPAAISKQGTSEGLIKSSRADQAEYLRQLHAKRAAATRSHMFGDDRRQQNAQSHTFGDDRRQQNT